MKRAFTLIELMVVISVIAILATIALFGFGKAQSAARDVQRAQSMNGIQAALERYYGDNGGYPSCYINNLSYFSSMMYQLNVGNYLNVAEFKDPVNGLAVYDIALPAGGACLSYPASRYAFTTGSGWTLDASAPTACGFTAYQISRTTASPKYAYWTDGNSYRLCLTKESGGFQEFKSPQ